MATIKFVNGADRKFTSSRERAEYDPVARRELEGRPPGDTGGRRCTHHRGSAESPQPELKEVRLPPGLRVSSHAHTVDEIIFVFEGSAIFGKQRYGAGSSVFIPRMTLYSFEAGPDGLTFLNFRPSPDEGLTPKERFLAMSSARGEGAQSNGELPEGSSE